MARTADTAIWFRETLEDESAFRAWYDGALPRVYGYLLHRCGGQRSVAEDLTQEAFVELVRSRRSFDGRSDPMTWVIGIARHKLADHFRRLAREERKRLRVVRGPVAKDASTETWAASERRQEIWRAMERLPTMQRAALTLHYMDDLPVSAVAAELGKSEAAIGSLLARGRETLRRELPTLDEVDDD